MERIKIYNLGPIKELDLELKQINIFIGSHASGKTIASQVVYFFKKISLIVDFTLENFDENLITSFEKNIQIDFDLSKNFYVEYNINDKNIIFEKKLNSEVEIRGKIFDYIKELSLETKNLKLKIKNQMSSILIDIHLKLVLKLMNYLNQNNNEAVYIPASRTLIPIVEDNTFDREYLNISEYLQSFGRFYTQIMKNFVNYDEEKNKKIKNLKKLAKKTLKGIIIKDENNKIKFKLNIDENIDISLISSGQLEALPIYISLMNSIKIKSNYFFIIEEPESHLHPEGQMEMVEFLAMVANHKVENNTNSLIVTTHSPFILTSFNNLIYAYDVKDEKVNEIVPKEQQINFDNVNALMFADGKVTSILNEKSRLIKQGSIAEISMKISDKFQSIMRLER